MNRKVFGIGLIGVVIIVIIMTIIFVKPIDVSPPMKENEFKNWHSSGPFAINKDEYKIGESIFLAVTGLMQSDKGNVIFILPNGTTKYIIMPFDGIQKSSFNYYFTPQISKARNICSINDIIGEWTVILQGTKYQQLKFKILNDTIPSEKDYFQKVC